MTSIWFSIILVGVFTFLTRLSFILLSEKIKINSTLQRMLQFVPITVLSAIILPEIVRFSSAQNLLPSLPRMLAGGVAIFIAWRTKNVVITIISGMLILFILNYLFSL